MVEAIVDEWLQSHGKARVQLYVHAQKYDRGNTKTKFPEWFAMVSSTAPVPEKVNSDIRTEGLPRPLSLGQIVFWSYVPLRFPMCGDIAITARSAVRYGNLLAI